MLGSSVSLRLILQRLSQFGFEFFWREDSELSDDASCDQLRWCHVESRVPALHV